MRTTKKMVASVGSMVMDVFVIGAEARQMKYELSWRHGVWSDEQVDRFCSDIRHLDTLGLKKLGQLLRDGNITQRQYWDLYLNNPDCYGNELPF